MLPAKKPKRPEKHEHRPIRPRHQALKVPTAPFTIIMTVSDEKIKKNHGMLKNL
jgi:hypothetical protein